MRFLDASDSLTGGEPDETIAVLQAIAFASPGLPVIWVRLAESLEESGALSESLEAWRMAHRLVPNSPRITRKVQRLEVESASQSAKASSPPTPQRNPPEELTVEPIEGPTKSERDVPIDIDLLISDLQSGRSLSTIEDYETDPDPSEHTGGEELATETLAGIFEAQNLFGDAVRIYDLLAEREENPGKAEILRARAEDLRKRITQRG